MRIQSSRQRLTWMPAMIEPFLKWPGGKRWLTKRHEDFFPKGYKRYLEPFLGGGAVFFHLGPAVSILSDANAELINAYKCLKRYPDVIDRRLRGLHLRHGAKLYYQIRASRPEKEITRAVRFIYLNRTCFNGIYRENLAGDFNVPMGTKNQVEYPVDYLSLIAQRLQKATLRESDFEKTIDEAERGDFVFVDPPYTVMHNSNNFVKYNASLFSWEDQVRLSASIRRAAKRGAEIMLSNADHESVRMLYCDFGYRYRVNRASVLAAESERRCKTSELLVTTFEIAGGKDVPGVSPLPAARDHQQHR